MGLSDETRGREGLEARDTCQLDLLSLQKKKKQSHFSYIYVHICVNVSHSRICVAALRGQKRTFDPSGLE